MTVAIPTAYLFFVFFFSSNFKVQLKHVYEYVNSIDALLLSCLLMTFL